MTVYELIGLLSKAEPDREVTIGGKPIYKALHVNRVVSMHVGADVELERYCPVDLIVGEEEVMTELPEGIAKGVHKAADGTMTDWTEEQILDEIIALTKFVEDGSRTGSPSVMHMALDDISTRLGLLYQEVGKKLLWKDGKND